jgi:hypothetical protein
MSINVAGSPAMGVLTLGSNQFLKVDYGSVAWASVVAAKISQPGESQSPAAQRDVIAVIELKFSINKIAIDRANYSASFQATASADPPTGIPPVSSFGQRSGSH